MFCCNCGGELGNTAKFCITCGTRVNRQNENTIQNSVTESGRVMYANVVNPTKPLFETLELVADIITGILAVIAGIMFIGAIFGAFDKNPVPFVVFILVVIAFEGLCDKLPKVPKIVFAVLEIIALIVCFNIVGDAATVTSVKSGYPYAYPNITYEMAFNDYFSNPTWKSAGKDEDGNNVVKFTGNCYYLDEKAIVEVRFTVYDDLENFVVSTVKINGVDMDWLGTAMIYEIFEEYKQSHNVR